MEFRAALRWVLGIPFRSVAYPCPDCGVLADPLGVHAVTCLRSGYITRGHNQLRNCVAELFGTAGLPVDVEQNLPGSLDRPADVLFTSWRGRPTAIDFTIITPTRPSAAAVTSSSSTSLMDQAAQHKQRKYQEACQAAGWLFQPFVADVYGAVRCDARGLITRFIKRFHHRFFPEDEAAAGQAIWSAISSAALSRAAMQLGRLSAADKPMGMAVNMLDLQTSRLRSSTLHSSLRSAQDTGIDTAQQPSLAASSVVEELFDLLAQAAEQEQRMSIDAAHFAPPTLPNRLLQITVISTDTNRRLHLPVSEHAGLATLQSLIESQTGTSAHLYELTNGTVPLQPNISLSAQGVADGTVLQFHPKASVAML